MSSEQLNKARKYEEQQMPLVPETERPVFHATGGVGWINDPNGFSPYRGEYHLFYQYHPYSTMWGPMHWGHMKTKDFIRWERLPVVLAPDSGFDCAGCFSGSAVELPDGRQLLLYTGVSPDPEQDGKVWTQAQCVAVGDGVDYEKYGENPVISGKDLPEGGSVYDFRDPKIWREDDAYYAVMGNRSADGGGAVLLYRSEDAVHWQYAATLDASHNRYGSMWECPDFFPLDGRHVLVVSPQEMRPVGLEFHAGGGTAALIGTYDKENFRFTRENVQAIDYGIDFYAPQTLQTYDGRRVMIGWMQNWATVGAQRPGVKIFGEMTLPRELRIEHGRLMQNPVRELESCRRNRVEHKKVQVMEEISLPGICGRVLDMILTVRPGEGGYRRFTLQLAQAGEYCTEVAYSPETDTVRIDRSRCGFPHDIVHVREFAVRPRGGELKLRVVLDRHSAELFVNGGEQAATFLLYADEGAEGISFRAEGCAEIDVEKYEIDIEKGDRQ